ncbi:MAG: 2TM domain-containing protein [Burkholderiales bacterium]|nr:2TM domain-containing protein [Burkholderiales bacterium]
MDRAECGEVNAPAAAKAAGAAARAAAGRAYRRHLYAYVLGNCALSAVNVYTGSPWWAFWPLIAWGLVLMIHFLVFRAATVDDSWVDERVQDLRGKSYDLGHMDVIRDNPAPSIGRDEN